MIRFRFYFYFGYWKLDRHLGFYAEQLICNFWLIANQTDLYSNKLEVYTVGLFVSYHVISSITFDILFGDL